MSSDGEDVAVDSGRLAALLDALYANSLDAVVVVDEAGTITYASSGMGLLLGYDTASVVGTSVFDFLHEDDVGTAAQLFVQRLGFDGTDQGLEIRVRNSAGSWVTANTTASLLPESAFGACALTLRGTGDESDEVEQALRRRIAVGDYTNRLAADVMEALDDQSVLDCVQRALADSSFLTGAEFAAVFLKRQGQSKVELVASWLSPAHADVSDVRLTDDAELFDVLFGEQVVIDSFDTLDTEQCRRLRDLTSPIGATGLLSAPFKNVRHDGLLLMARLTPDRFWWESDKQLGTGVAGLLGKALQTANWERLLRLTYGDGPTGFSIRAWTGSLVDCNQQYLDLFGLTRREAREVGLGSLLKPGYRSFVTKQLERLRTGEIDRFDAITEIVRADKTELWVRSRAVRYEAFGEPDGLVLTSVEDITTAHSQQLELEHAASHDPLTGVANRVAMRAAIAEMMSANGRLPALFIFDLDRFKLVNDSMGHVVGDRVLQAVVERIGEAVRPSDVVARLGGDEFAIVVPTIDTAAAHKFAERLRQGFQRPLDVDGRTIPMTISVGVALGEDSANAADLLVHADRALYAAKAGGRNRHTLFDESMRDEVVNALALERELRHALDDGQLEVHFQPEFAVADRRILGAEALLRWEHPERGRIPAGEFIEIAEHSGMIDDIGRFALRAATSSFAAICDAVGADDLILRVNISGREFVRPELADLVRSALDDSGLAPHRLCLEMTELTLMDVPEMVLATFVRLREIGVHLAIDDFGTGYSSLAYLKRFPVDVLKIDRAFIEDIVGDPDSRAIVESIVGLSRALSLVLVAEGVETEQQLEQVQRLGIERAQGYLVAAALPPTELFTFLVAARDVRRELH